MALVLNGSGTIAGLSAGGLPDGSVAADDLASTLDLSGKTVTLPSGTGGKVLQVVSMTDETYQDITTTGYVDITNGSLSITPSSASSKILAFADIPLTLYAGTVDGWITASVALLRGSTIVSEQGVGDRGYSDGTARDHYNKELAVIKHLDSPSTTSSVTYKLQAQRLLNTSSCRVNYDTSRGEQLNFILMEIAG